MNRTIIASVVALSFTLAGPALAGSDSAITGAAGGAVAGAVVGGPVGAAVGGAAGAVIGGAAGDQTDTVVVQPQPDAVIVEPVPGCQTSTVTNEDAVGNSTTVRRSNCP